MLFDVPCLGSTSHVEWLCLSAFLHPFPSSSSWCCRWPISPPGKSMNHSLDLLRSGRFWFTPQLHIKPYSNVVTRHTNRARPSLTIHGSFQPSGNIWRHPKRPADDSQHQDWIKTAAYVFNIRRIVNQLWNKTKFYPRLSCDSKTIISV